MLQAHMLLWPTCCQRTCCSDQHAASTQGAL